MNEVQFAFCHIQGLMSSFNSVWPIYNKRAAVGMLHILCESCHTQNVGLRVSLSINVFTNLERFALVGTSSILHDKALVISVSGDGGNLVWKSNGPENKNRFGIEKSFWTHRADWPLLQTSEFGDLCADSTNLGTFEPRSWSSGFVFKLLRKVREIWTLLNSDLGRGTVCNRCALCHVAMHFPSTRFIQKNIERQN